jgi:NifB/MoaA-like Fe-S oxidoreductase
VIDEGLSPLNVSIHATDPEVRARMLRNRRGATSLRWLRALLDHGVMVHGQVVVCPGVNDGAVLEDTLTGVLDQYPELATLCVVPLGVSRFNREGAMRPHSTAEAEAVVGCVHDWQDRFLTLLGRRLVFAADEYYLLAGRPFPGADSYEGFPMHEDGIGMARTFELEFAGLATEPVGVQSGFFAWVDGAPASGYRAPRNPAAATGLRVSGTTGRVGAPVAPVTLLPSRLAQVGVLTGAYGARVLRPLLATLDRDGVRVIEVANEFFGGNTGVAGLMVGEDLSRALAAEPEGHRYLLPDVCLSDGRFLDGMVPGDLPRPVEVIPTDGIALRRALTVGAAV